MKKNIFKHIFPVVAVMAASGCADDNTTPLTTDENAVIAAVTAAGYDPYEHKILGVTAMTSLLGKKQFNDILGGLITKPQGKPTLVPDSDKRPAMTTIIDDFKEDK